MPRPRQQSRTREPYIAILQRDCWNRIIKTRFFTIWGAMHIGKVRLEQQDAMLLDQRGLFAVADGMGSYAGSAIASGAALNGFFQAATVEDCNPHEVLFRANEAVRDQVRANPRLDGMGTTLTGLGFFHNEEGLRAYYWHVGDTRLYSINPVHPHLVQITQDHSMGPFLESALCGKGIKYLKVDVIPVMEKDVFLLCSDGLMAHVPDHEIEEIILCSLSPAEELVHEAVKRGGKDNVSVLVIQVRPRSRPSSPQRRRR